MEGYAKIVGKEKAKDVLEKTKEIERRGRYVIEREER
jgi:tRNA A-37 threonylcarbamoyl transferase component Bud32